MGSTCGRYADYLYSPPAFTAQFRLDFVHGQEAIISRKCWVLPLLSAFQLTTICEREGSNSVIVGNVIYIKHTMCTGHISMCLFDFHAFVY